MTAASAVTAEKSASAFDLASIAACTLIWGTTWFAITLQFGVVDPVISVAYRFGLASALLFAVCLVRRENLALSLSLTQHAAVFGMGLFTFGVNYACVYWAEQRINSAVVAVIFAMMAFVNLALFRAVFAQRAAPMAWIGAVFGVGGVALLSWGELADAPLSNTAFAGLGLAFASVFTASIGNVFAHRAASKGVSILASTAWGMAYGASAIALFATLTGRHWAFALTPTYVLSLLYLSGFGSVTAFLLYFGVARRRGYAVASYISAMTPPVAMLVSSLFEAKHWGPPAFAGVAFVVAGQVLLLRTKRAQR
ncbi:MAG: EamA family transporter [Pseudomonadota bacterium]